MKNKFWLQVKDVFTGYPYLYYKSVKTVYGTQFTKPNVDVPAEIPTCPFCGHALKLSDTKRKLESLAEHIENPNSTPSYKYVGVCSNDACEFGKFWMYNYYTGEAYLNKEPYFAYFFEEGPDGKPDIHKYRSNEHKILDEEMDKFIMCAGNTFECQSVFSILKAGLIDCIYLHPLLGLGIRQPVIEIDYDCDRQGNVKSKSYKLRFLAWENGGFNVYKSTEIKRFFSILSSRLKSARKFKQLLADPTTPTNHLREYYNKAFTLGYRPKNDKPTRAAIWCVKVLHPHISRYTFK